MRVLWNINVLLSIKFWSLFFDNDEELTLLPYGLVNDGVEHYI